MEINDIQNVHNNVWVSPSFLKEIENVATRSTNGVRGTSEVAEQLGDFITYTIRFLQNLGNQRHNAPYVPYGNGLMGYITGADDAIHGIGDISFRVRDDNVISVEDISIDLSNYSLLIENRKNGIVITESDLRQMIKESITRILAESGSSKNCGPNGYYIEKNGCDYIYNGEKCHSRISVVYKNGKQKYHIDEDDHCYVFYVEMNGKEAHNYENPYIFDELLDAIKMLPQLS